ncbi:amidase [Aliihoeflea aestuarii]|uniref:amidase n=1 Tax=Aliihoeflea aestuarii TaxID=453840 RepID=UPI00209441A1|nr:amidase family protein [Aliihoeflea aestuarii]MCO6392153.1 amidase [Aliihoeflea aestuarii]
MTSELISKSACEIVDRLRAETLDPHRLLDALEERIAAVEPSVNALPTLAFERARAHADAMLKRPVSERGLLAGIPVAIKDLTEVEGVRTTHGSRIFENNISARSDIMVTHLETEGALIYAKTATPEFGAGANTFNDVFGATLNPWNISRSAAGSSGGSAVALATGMAWLAQGSDLGGSLRNPASFCGIVGLRPSPGRVAADPGLLVDDILSVEGPMARTVEDVGLFLDAMSGEDTANPISLPRDGTSYRAAAQSRALPARIAFSADLGITPVDPEVADICRAAAYRFAELGVDVVDAHPDLSGAHETFQTLRAVSFATGHASKLKTHRDLLKPEVIWNIEKGLALTVGDVAKAEARRAGIITRALAFFDDYDLLLTPATIVAPFPVENRYVTECAGKTFETYIDWLAIAYAITLTTAPALSLPCGFTREGLPVGLQIVARPRGEARLLAAAAALEHHLDLGTVDPIDPRSGN